MSIKTNRCDMPQIDECDLTALVEWLSFNGIAVRSVKRSYRSLTLRQRTCLDPARGLPPIDRPIMISSDGCVLDGNHRALADKRLKRGDIDCLELGLPFLSAIDALFTFKGTYRTCHASRPRHSEAEAERMEDAGYI